MHAVPQPDRSLPYPAGDTPLRLLLLDSSSFDLQLLEERLQRDGLRYVLRQVATEPEFRDALAQPWDLILSEIALPDMSARLALAILAERGVDIPLVILTSLGDENLLAGLIAAGAADYVFKNRLGRLTQALRLALERARLLTRLETKRAHLAQLSTALIHAQEHERRALARELHDELGQRLTALNLLLHRAEPYFHDDEGKALWRQGEREMASLIGLVRDMSVSLRPPGLDFFGLEPTLRQLLARQFEAGPAWVFEYAGLPRRLDPTLEISVYRLVQESVTNIVRHACAHHVVVEINGGATGDELELIVRDDGAGFDATGWREHGARAGRAGLSGMYERVHLLGGSFAVDSAPGHGTRISALLPLNPKENRR